MALVDGLSIVKSTREFALATQFRFLLLFFPLLKEKKKMSHVYTRVPETDSFHVDRDRRFK